MLVSLERGTETSLQSQLLRAIVEAIHAGQMGAGQKMLSSRQLAGQLGIARNTVTAVYEELVSRGYLESRPRKGYFVQPNMTATGAAAPFRTTHGSVNWQSKLAHHPSGLRYIEKPSNWQEYRYPFVCGQVDPNLFPFNTWRACSRDTLGRKSIDWWAADRAGKDDPLLIDQIRSQILPRRGIYAREEEILITLGSQEGFFLMAHLLAKNGLKVGAESPGYPDSRNIFAVEGAQIEDLQVDASGAVPSQTPLDLAILTPCHHCPSMVTMSAERRADWLVAAKRDGTILLEDDYEGETSFLTGNLALKSQDDSGHVVYLGTLSKVLAPGMRLGFMVGDAELIKELRWMRRLMHRSAPLNNQRLAAIFMAEGHYAALIRQLHGALERRFARAVTYCDQHLPGFKRAPAEGGASLWLELPEGIEAKVLRQHAMTRDVLTEDGDAFVGPDQQGRHLRLGITYISEAAIEPGLAALFSAAEDLDAGRLKRNIKRIPSP